MNELYQRLYSAALNVVTEADESSKDVTLPGDAFHDLELAVNFIRERKAMTIIENEKEVERDIEDPFLF